MKQTSNEQHSSLVEKFNDLGKTEISEVQLGQVEENIKSVFLAYPTKYFTQKDFVGVLGKSNPRIHHGLMKLMKENVITRIGSKRQYFYIKIQ